MDDLSPAGQSTEIDKRRVQSALNVFGCGDIKNNDDRIAKLSPWLLAGSIPVTGTTEHVSFQNERVSVAVSSADQEFNYFIVYYYYFTIFYSIIKLLTYYLIQKFVNCILLLVFFTIKCLHI